MKTIQFLTPSFPLTTPKEHMFRIHKKFLILVNMCFKSGVKLKKVFNSLTSEYSVKLKRFESLCWKLCILDKNGKQSLQILGLGCRQWTILNGLETMFKNYCTGLFHSLKFQQGIGDSIFGSLRNNWKNACLINQALIFWTGLQGAFQREQKTP